MTVDASYLARFTNAPHERLVAFAAQSPRLGDLAHTHPLAFVALATGYGDAERRAAAVTAALEGRRLGIVCDLAGIPRCLRSVPPEFCPEALPFAEWSAGASRTLGCYVPNDPTVLIDWLPAVFFAHGAAGEVFALWLAKRHELFNGMGLPHHRLLSLALYAWFADHPEHELGRLIPDRWSFHTGTTRMFNATRTWLNRIVCRTYLPARGNLVRHTACDRIGPFFIFGLTDYRHLLDEQQVMSNCLDRYGRRIASGTHRLFSLRNARGMRFATFEVAMNDPDGPVLGELKGIWNGNIPARMTRAIEAWVKHTSQRMSGTDAVYPSPSDPHDRATAAEECFRTLLEPYVRANTSAFKNTDVISLSKLEGDLADVAQRIGITEWPAYFEGSNQTQFL